MQLLISIMAIMFMIVIHEWGHFIAGRICGMKIYEFSIGMGPAIFKHKGKKETVFSLRALPIGGYCAFDNLEDVSSLENGMRDSALDELPIWKRIFVCFAGPFMNLFLGFLLILCVNTFAGEQIATTRVDSVIDGEPAAECLVADDVFLSIDGEKVETGDDVTRLIQSSKGKELEIVVLRNGSEETVYVTPKQDETSGNYYLGFYQSVDYLKVPLTKSIPNSIKDTFQSMGLVFESLYGLLTGKYGWQDASGIVGVVDIMGDYATPSTILPFALLASFISINLGIMNLLPIPGLDGSKILLAFFELITRKKPNQKIMDAVTTFSMLLLLGASLVLVISDVFKMF